MNRIILSCVFSLLALSGFSQYKLISGFSESTYLTFTHFGPNGLTLVYSTKTDNTFGRHESKYITLDPNSDAIKTGEAFGSDFYKTNKKYTNFEYVYQSGKYLVTVGEDKLFAETDEKKLVSVFDMETSRIFSFEMDGEKGKTSKVIRVIGTYDYIIFFVKREQAYYWTQGQLSTNYYIYKLKTADQTVEEKEFILRDKDITINEAFETINDEQLIVSYYTKGKGYALLNLKTTEMKAVSAGISSYNYIYLTSVIPMNSGKLMMVGKGAGGGGGANEIDYVFIAHDGTSKALGAIPFPKLNLNNQDKFIPVHTNEKVYYLWVTGDKLAIRELSPEGARIVEVEMGGKYPIQTYLSVSKDTISWWSGKKQVNLNLSDLTVSVQDLDKNFDPEYSSIVYNRNGTSDVIFFKYESGGVMFKK